MYMLHMPQRPVCRSNLACRRRTLPSCFPTRGCRKDPSLLIRRLPPSVSQWFGRLLPLDNCCCPVPPHCATRSTNCRTLPVMYRLRRPPHPDCRCNQVCRRRTLPSCFPTRCYRTDPSPLMRRLPLSVSQWFGRLLLLDNCCCPAP